MTDREKLLSLINEIQDEGIVYGEHDYGVRVDNERLADHLIQSGGLGQRWIPVTERLPQEDQPLGALCEVVQVLLEDNTVTVGYCNRGMQMWLYLPLRGTHFVGTGFEGNLVVAWMPISEPPSGERKDNG